jgi:hypothetical protein
VLFSEEGGFGVGAQYTVRVRKIDTPRARDREVWTAYRVAPVHLRWAGDDSLTVVVPDDEDAHMYANQIVITPGVLASVRTFRVSFGDSALTLSHVYNHPDRRRGEKGGVEDVLGSKP